MVQSVVFDVEDALTAKTIRHVLQRQSIVCTEDEAVNLAILASSIRSMWATGSGWYSNHDGGSIWPAGFSEGVYKIGNKKVPIVVRQGYGTECWAHYYEKMPSDGYSDLHPPRRRTDQTSPFEMSRTSAVLTQASKL